MALNFPVSTKKEVRWHSLMTDNASRKTLPTRAVRLLRYTRYEINVLLVRPMRSAVLKVVLLVASVRKCHGSGFLVDTGNPSTTDNPAACTARDSLNTRCDLQASYT